MAVLQNSHQGLMTQEGNVTVVRTAEGLYQAMREGMPHIELQEHIFLTHPDKPMYLGVVPDSVQSIRVCSYGLCCLHKQNVDKACTHHTWHAADGGTERDSDAHMLAM